MNLQTLHSMFSFLQVLELGESMCCSGYHQRPASPPGVTSTSGMHSHELAPSPNETSKSPSVTGGATSRGLKGCGRVQDWCPLGYPRSCERHIRLLPHNPPSLGRIENCMGPQT